MTRNEAWCDPVGDLYDDYSLSSVEVTVTDPLVLGYLYGPDGEPFATLLDRRVVPFGFQIP